MNAWLRQIHGANRLYMSRAKGEAMGIAQDDWVWVESRNGRVKGQVTLMEGVNPDTVWTWNAIGKRAGAWMLSPDAAEAERGFLLEAARHQRMATRANRPTLGQCRSHYRSGRLV
jgi:anaerobic selenocysteine-containing dehydrogenase